MGYGYEDLFTPAAESHGLYPWGSTSGNFLNQLFFKGVKKT
jgi:hypothetical protein